MCWYFCKIIWIKFKTWLKCCDSYHSWLLFHNPSECEVLVQLDAGSNQCKLEILSDKKVQWAYGAVESQKYVQWFIIKLASNWLFTHRYSCPMPYLVWIPNNIIGILFNIIGEICLWFTNAWIMDDNSEHRVTIPCFSYEKQCFSWNPYF